MSHEQWAAIMRGDESYAGRALLLPPQSRRARTSSASSISSPPTRAAPPRTSSAAVLVKPGDSTSRSNMHFDTTDANIRARGGRPTNLVIDEACDPANPHPVQGQHGPRQARAPSSKRSARRTSPSG
ncbi:MAG: hypothetical protein M0C28_28325 [Candidatus Moduliflexus flocculans]|nr:hypothetical protein [Candidatus Moduliflexus flocculans]